MFGRKQKLIEHYRNLLFQEITYNLKLRDRLETLTSTHNAFAIVEDYLLKLSEDLRRDGSKIVFREKHKNSEGNIFVSENKYDAVQIDNITRALYEVEKSERRKNK